MQGWWRRCQAGCGLVSFPRFGWTLQNWANRPRGGEVQELGHSRYSPEFRRDAVELARTSGQTVKAIARDLGVSAESLYNWVKQDRIDRGEGAPGELTTAEKQELSRLRRENAQLRMEREILKKAAAFFAKETIR